VDARWYVAVVGPGQADPELTRVAELVGRELGEQGAVVVCGGRGGVMEAACAGAVSAGGITVGILPGTDRSEANPHVRIALPTGIGEMRNALVVRAADVVIAVGGGHGTLSEVALALKTGVPVVGYRTWRLERGTAAEVGLEDEAIIRVETAEAAVAQALRLAGAV
jgi:uncharacterized protein (TIGR00725 family)